MAFPIAFVCAVVPQANAPPPLAEGGEAYNVHLAQQAAQVRELLEVYIYVYMHVYMHVICIHNRLYMRYTCRAVTQAVLSDLHRC
jgi:hypothetical protein